MRNKLKLHMMSVLAGASMMAFTPLVNAANTDDDWQFGFKIYAFLPDINGELNYAPPGGSDDISVDIGDILDSLKMTFMGSFEARKGKWSGFTDVIYMDVGDDKSKSVSLPNDTTVDLLDADLDLKAVVWTLGGAYTIWRDQKSYVDLLAGARLLALDTEVKLTGGGPQQHDRKLSGSEDLWDGIIGAKGSYSLSDRWFIPYYVDVGTGDAELTWQVSGGIGYEFNWGEVRLDYRHIEYDQGSGKLIKDLAFGGPSLGAAFRF